MLIELGGGLNPHPHADVIIDPIHPLAAPAQRAQDTPWRFWPDLMAPSDIPQAVRSPDGLAAIPDGCADHVYASHVVEHIAKGEELIATMNEAWRVLRDGGYLTLMMPLVGYTEPRRNRGRLTATWQPYADPTHVDYWWLPEGVLYFCEGPFRPAAEYAINVWMPLGPFVPEKRVQQALSAQGGQSFWSVRSGWEGLVRLVKPSVDATSRQRL